MIAQALLMTTLATTPPALIGTWAAETDPHFLLDLREEGLAAYFLGAYFWVADEKSILLIDPTQPEEARRPVPGDYLAYTLAGERLTIPLDGKMVVTFVRQPGTARPGPVATPKWIGNGYAETTSGLWYRKYFNNQGLLLTSEHHWERATKIDRGTIKTVCGLTVDAHHVYDNGSALPNIDAATFHELGHGCCADKTSVRVGAVKQVWAEKPDHFVDFDVATFEPLLGELVKDRNGVYSRNEIGGPGPSEPVGGVNYRIDSWERLDLPDATTFETLTASTARDRRYEYRIAGDATRLVISRALQGGKVVDLGAGFQLADGVISFGGRRLEHADPTTFEVLLKLPKEQIYRGYWARDRNAVWYGARRVAGADPRTFTVMNEGSNRYAFDARGRYEIGQPLDPAWSEKFEQLRTRWLEKKKAR